MTVSAVIGISAHRWLLVVLRPCYGWKKQNPRSGCRPGVCENCSGGDPACWGACTGYQARLWLNHQYPK
ncbi:hypothetical protein AvCA_33220 [Azotobacter vinelandii CA]|uniref:Uncharacterized protein n=2 Tax=Azotobacter vinelandii TaxID=354 RepID=C1DPQ5_AZOVD|nr:hypothetical protein Avin_33220 [Azotobacter vinelandii DJ]AGK14673.1 hypothetical protein AvCA_33220 [Azotobacter vinelandii CA]AGK21253.1 hypothetical protein AvCA6_33220 [Azotobacter vinelandii CA6]